MHAMYMIYFFQTSDICAGYECSDWVSLNVLGVNIGEVCLSLTPAGVPLPQVPVATGRGEVPVATRGERRAVEGRVQITSRQGGGSTSTSFEDARTICQVTVKVALLNDLLRPDWSNYR